MIYSLIVYREKMREIIAFRSAGVHNRLSISLSSPLLNSPRCYKTNILNNPLPLKIYSQLSRAIAGKIPDTRLEPGLKKYFFYKKEVSYGT